MTSLRTPNSNSKDFEKHPPGMAAARCYQVIDLGSHWDEKWKKTKRLVRVVFESTRLMADGRPFSIAKRYTLSHHEKAQLRGDLESWYGKRFDTKALDDAGGFDLAKLIGRPALINVVHSEDGKYANVATITPLVDGMPEPPAVNPTLLFSLDVFDPAVFAKLSPKLQEFISTSDERNPKAKVGTSAASDTGGQFEDSDIPF